MPRVQAEQAARRAFGEYGAHRRAEPHGVAVASARDSHRCRSPLRSSPAPARLEDAPSRRASLVATGIASVSIFTFVNAALLKPLPYQDPARLVAVFGSTASCPACSFSYADYQDWKRGNSVFRSFEIWQPDAYLWRSSGGVESLRAGRVSGGFFQTLGVTPILGRLFTAEDDEPSAPRAQCRAPSHLAGTPRRTRRHPRSVHHSRQQCLHHHRRPSSRLRVRPAGCRALGHNPRPRFLRKGPRVPPIFRPRPPEGRRLRLCGICQYQRDRLSTAKAVSRSPTWAGARVRDALKDESITGDIRPILLIPLAGPQFFFCSSPASTSPACSLLAEAGKPLRREMAVFGALGMFARLTRQLDHRSGPLLVALSVSFGLAAAWGAVDLTLAALIPERVLEACRSSRQLVSIIVCFSNCCPPSRFSRSPSLHGRAVALSDH